MTDTPYHFQTNIPADEWTERAQFGSLVPRACHRLARMTSAADDVTRGDVIAAALLTFSALAPEERSAAYAEIADRASGSEATE